MKKTFRTAVLLLASILILFTSCNDRLQKMDDGSVNEYIYPYLRFTPTEDGTSLNVSVLVGAKLNTVKIPSDVNGVKVGAFVGFENPEDAKSVKDIILGSCEVKVTEDALKQAENLENLKIKPSSEPQYWGRLPVLEKEGYEFFGWYAGEELIIEGMMMDPEHTVAVPAWRAHTYIEHEGKEPTCTEPGWKPYRTCETCDYNDRVDLPALGHELSHVASNPSTCTGNGNREYWQCNRCGLKFSDADGRDVIDEVVLPALGHKLSKVPEVPATCSNLGIREHWECERCRLRFFDASGENPVVDDSALIIPMTPHTLGEEWISDGTHHWHACTVCGDQLEYSRHTWNEGEVIVKPTADRPGKIRFTCTVCNHTKEEVMQPESDHAFEVYITKDATCTEDGYVIMKCSKCGLTYTDVIPSKNHSAREMVEAVEPTCTSAGNIRYWYCRDCGRYFSDSGCTHEITREETVREPLGHNWSDVYASDAAGHWHECTRCDAISEKVAHEFNLENPGDLKALKSSATCTTPAVYYRSCVCGAADNNPDNTFEYGDPLGHDLVHHPATDRPCAEDGHVEYWECTRCNRKFSDSEGRNEMTDIRAEHIQDGWDVSKPGFHRPRCKVCHSGYGEWTTHRESGWYSDKSGHWKDCEVCGEILSAKVPHTLEIRDGKKVCTVCGFVDEDNITGGDFDVSTDMRLPKGTLSSTRDGNVLTVEYRNSNLEYPATEFSWYLDDVLVETNSTGRFTCELDHPRNYKVMCLYGNEWGRNSETLDVVGGIAD